MQRKRVLLRHRLEYILFKSYIFKIKILPHFFFKFDRYFILFLFKILNKRHSAIVDKNLNIAFPDYNREQRAKLKKDIYSHFSKIFLEIIYLFAKKNSKKTLPEININGMEKISEILSRNKGLIIFSAHFGNWELIPYLLHTELKKTIYSIARKMDNPLVENIVTEFREFMGSDIIYKDKAIRTILTLLDKNEIVFLLIDHNTIEREGVKVNFFGKEVFAVSSVAQIHLKKDIPVLPVFIKYEKDKIVFDIKDEVKFNKSSDKKKDIQILTQIYTDIIEDNIKENPHQWFWFHNRWKSSTENK